MSFLKKLFGKKDKSISLKENQSLPSERSPEDADSICIYDEHGRELYIEKEEWRTKVLPHNISKAWNDPDRLYDTIIQALNDGFRTDVLLASEHLYKTDPEHMRAACIWGIMLMHEGRLDEAETVFQDFLSKHGENGIILTNLAKLYAKRGNDQKTQETLWHALEVDPNQDNGMLWYWALQREEGGEDAGVEALRRVAALPNSWRAQLFLGQNALREGHFDQALALYRECLNHVDTPVPTELLMQMSGELGSAHQLEALLEICGPHFIPEIHGLMVGSNLIKAHLALGHIHQAAEILDSLYKLNRPDFREDLSFWDSEISKARQFMTTEVEKTPSKIEILHIDGPVWLQEGTLRENLFQNNEEDKINICILGSSAKMMSSDGGENFHLTNPPGRMSRALPLFLAEQLFFHTNSDVQTLIPWIIKDKKSGFILTGEQWTDKEAAQYIQENRVPADYMILIHLTCTSDFWTVELRFVRAIDAVSIGDLKTSFSYKTPEEAILLLMENVIAMILSKGEFRSRKVSPIYSVPSGTYFSHYLICLEQLLSVRCSGMDGMADMSLSCERSILDGNIELCLSCPENVVTRLLLAKTLLAMKKARPDILPEFKSRVGALQNQHPVIGSDRIQEVIDEAFS